MKPVENVLEAFYARGAAPWATSVEIVEERGSLKVTFTTGNTDTTHHLTRAAAEALGEALLRSLSHAKVRDGDVEFSRRAGKFIPPKAAATDDCSSD